MVARLGCIIADMHERSLGYLTLSDAELKERVETTCDCKNCMMHRTAARAEIARRTLIWNPPLPKQDFSPADIVGDDQKR